MILQEQKQNSNNSLDIIESDKSTNPLFRKLAIQSKESSRLFCLSYTNCILRWLKSPSLWGKIPSLFFFSEEFQLINAERMTDLEKSPACNPCEITDLRSHH